MCKQIRPVLVFSGLLIAPFALCIAAQAQPKKVAHIGYISARTVESEKDWQAAFRQGLRELGYLEGRDILIEQRYAEGKYERIPELLEEVTGLNPAVLVVTGDP